MLEYTVNVTDISVSVQAFVLAPGLTLCLGNSASVMVGVLSW